MSENETFAAPDAPPQEGIERKIREYLWLSHGHQGLYGDDGEMQCGMCAPMWDYKRAPLAELVAQALKVRHEIHIAALKAASPSQDAGKP